MFKNSLWIWTKDSFKNQRVNFFFEKDIDVVPNSAKLCIGCETKYRLFVNGAMVVHDGGLFRESVPGCGWYDVVELSSFLKEGHNDFAIQVWFYGNGGRNNSKCDKPGLIFDCDELNLHSDSSVLCETDEAFYIPSDNPPSYLYGGDHTAFDARIHPFSLCPQPASPCEAIAVGRIGDAPWGELAERIIPLFRFFDRVSCQYSREGDVCVVSLPCAMQFSPYIKAKAKGGEKLKMYSDRYLTNGGPGDSGSYYCHRGEYICTFGEQEFEMSDWIFGEKIIFEIPDGVEISELGYRRSCYDTDVTTSFECDDMRVNSLFEKCVTTLTVCMRENYMDCPDRERGQWIGDISVQAPQIIYLLDKKAHKLLRKAICDFINLRSGDVLTGLVPGDNKQELPSQSLNAISEYGMISVYYEATQDLSVLKMAFEPAVKYLMLWETDDQGVVLPRVGGWEWYDHLYNCDKAILNICWYYSALSFAKKMAELIDNHSYDSFLKSRSDAIETVFEKRYWKQTEGFYASGDFADDRANAMVVLCGLCPRERYPQIRYLLMSLFNSSVYMENYVLMALCEMGFKQDAFRRMMCRYQPLIDNENSTLWEDFFHLGTRNHAWTGAPATILLRYFVGIGYDLEYNAPDSIAPLKKIKCSFVNKNEEKISAEL